MTKKSRQIFKYLKYEKSFMTFFIFNGLSLKQIKYIFFWKVGVRLQGSFQKLFDTGIPVWAPKLLRPKKVAQKKAKLIHLLFAIIKLNKFKTTKGLI